MRMARGFFTVGFWTLASRILGFLRDVLIASYLGTGAAHQAFVAAFALPNLFRRFFAEGALNMAFVPMFSKKLESGDDPYGFASDALVGLATVVVFLTLIAQIFMPGLVWLQVSGYYGTEKFPLTVDYGRICFPYIVLISLAALLSGMLNAMRHFAAAAAAPVLLNVVFIGAIFIAGKMGYEVARALVWAVPVGGVAQLVLVWIAAKRAGFVPRLRWPHMTPDLKRLAIIAAPAALAGGVVQINLLVGRQVASQTDGAVSWLYNADRLYQLPLGVVGIAIGIVLLPELSRRLAANDQSAGKAALSRAGEMALMLTVPSAVALAVIPGPLVSVLFERGAFTANDTDMTALAVLIYGLGLPSFVLQKVLQPVYFAREDTKTPFKFAIVSMVVNAAVAVGLMPVIGFFAAAVATTLSGWIMFFMLLIGARRFGDVARFDARFRTRAWRITLASFAMGGWLLLTMTVIGPMFGYGGWRWLGLLILVTSGMLSYGIFGMIFKAFRLSDLKASLRRGA